MAYVQLRDRIISLLAGEEIEDELCCWREFLDGIDQALDAGHEYLNKECDSEEQSSKRSLISNCLALNCPSLVAMC